MRHVVLVGATDGIGLALARAHLERSWRVAVVGRSSSKVDRVVTELREAVPGGTVVGGVLDVTQRARTAGVLNGVLADLGQMDRLVYTAGVMDDGPRATGRMIDVNTVGAIDVLEWGAAYLTEAGQGRLAAIGSVAGDRGRRGNPVYGASKAALHQYLEGLRHRLHDQGVGVTTIKPGWVRTRMLGDVPGFPPSIAASRAAELIVRGLDAERDAFYVPAWWGLVSLVLRALPRPVFKRMAPP
ncbi:MAG: SDR family NAD(P)-dependent oxidoreductase [Longimicrobiales bacterium]